MQQPMQLNTNFMGMNLRLRQQNTPKSGMNAAPLAQTGNYRQGTPPTRFDVSEFPVLGKKASEPTLHFDLGVVRNKVASDAQQQPPQQPPFPISQDTGKAAKKSGSSEEKYGLTGLLRVIRMTNPDVNTLALGTDLTTLGLSLNSTEALCSTFNHPLSENVNAAEADFVLPTSYYSNPPNLKLSHLQKFNVETLFYLFYAIPRDELQLCAAKELYNRNWRFHREMKLWFCRPPPEMLKELGTDQVSYICFDVRKWEKRLFQNRTKLFFLAEDEIVSALTQQ